MKSRPSAPKKSRLTEPDPRKTELNFPPLLYPDLATQYPRLHANSTKPDSVPIDDVDILQYELESLWTHVILRMRTLQVELTSLESTYIQHYDPTHQEKINAVKSIIDSGHGTRTSVSAAVKLVMPLVSPVPAPVPSPALPGSSRKSNNSAAAATTGPLCLLPARQPKKKLKEAGKGRPGGSNRGAAGGKNRVHSLSLDPSSTKTSSRMDSTPNQFWEFADSYCREVTAADLEALNKHIAEFRHIPETVFHVPPLGRHFNSDSPGSSQGVGPPDRKLRFREACGPITQRLVGALVEDRIMQFQQQPQQDGVGTGLIHRADLVRALGLDGEPDGEPKLPLEARLTQVLLEQGLLMDGAPGSPADNDPDDVILAEIKRTLDTLNILHGHNLRKLEALAKAANNEHTRSIHRSELDRANREVIDAYRVLAACRLKRKPLTQKEKNAAGRALQRRQAAIEKLKRVETDVEILDLTGIVKNEVAK